MTAIVREQRVSSHMQAPQPADQSNPSIVELDLFDIDALGQFLDESDPFDVVINATGYAVQRDQNEIEMAQKVNTDLPSLLVKMFDGHSKRFIHIGTSYEYGAVDGPVSEQTACKPTTLYGQSKLDGTHRLLDQNVNSLHLICLRLFGTFGPHENQRKLFPLLFKVHAKGLQESFSSGHQRLDYMHVENAIDAMIHLVRSTPVRNTELFNVGSGQAFSIREISEKFADHFGTRAAIDWGALVVRSNDSSYQFANISKIHAHTGWRPRLSLDEGIKLFIKQMES